MAKIKNRHVYGTPDAIKALKDECDYIGRNVSRIDRNDPGHLIIYALPPKKRDKPKKDEDEQRPTRRGKRRGNGFNRYKEMQETSA